MSSVHDQEYTNDFPTHWSVDWSNPRRWENWIPGVAPAKLAYAAGSAIGYGLFGPGGPRPDIKTNDTSNRFRKMAPMKRKRGPYPPTPPSRRVRPRLMGRLRMASAARNAGVTNINTAVGRNMRRNVAGNRRRRVQRPYRNRRRIGGRRGRRRITYNRMMSPSLHGVTQTVERSGALTTESNNALYLGHGISTEQFWVNLCRAIVRKLYRQMGEEIFDWNLNISGPSTSYTLDIQYATAIDQDTYSLDSSTLATQTYSAVASQLYTRFVTIFSENDSNIFINSINIKQTTGGQVVSRLVTSSCEIQYTIVSFMRIQNASVGGSGTQDIEDENKENVTNNPLVGKLYSSKARANGFKLGVIRNVGASDTVQTVADRSTGLVLWGVTDLSSSDMKDLYKKPPPGRQFNLKAYPYGISPGQIKSFGWKDKRKIKLHHLIEKMKTSFTQNTTGQYQNAGFFKMVGLEKKMACISNEFQLVVHWQLNQSYNFVCRKILGRSNRITQIVDPA